VNEKEHMSMSELRQRSGAASSKIMEHEIEPILKEQGAGLVAKALVDSSPQQHDIVLKLHIPVLYNIIPSCLLRIIRALDFLSICLPSWKQRYLILCGSFLYKYKDQSSQVPKGEPFHVETATAKIVMKEYSPHVGSLPPGFDTIFSVSTMRRKHYYAVRDNEEAMIWIRSMQQARQEAITRNMGHAQHVPYPKSWQYFDSLGKSLVKSKERIKERLEGARLREMEMSNFAEAGPLPRGYHG
jgi:hypothetical protein